MSWSIDCVGKPEAVKRAIATAIERYGPASDTNVSRKEFEQAQPHLEALLDMTIGDAAVVKLSAGGSASWVDGKPVNGTCKVSIEPLYGFVQ